MLVRLVSFKDRREYARSVLPDLARGGLFIRTDEPMDVGAPIVLELCFPEIPEGIFVSGRIVWRRLPTRWKSALPAGIGVEYDASEKTKVEFLADFVKGQLSQVRKRTRRLPIRMPARFQSIGSAVEASGETRDIGRGGLFLASDTMVRFGSSLSLSLFAPEDLHLAGPTNALGRVAWVGHMNGVSGMGVQFLFRTPDVRAGVEELVSRLEDRLGGHGSGPAIGAALPR
jgi:Tfp pilus assembly protein PilZ